MRRGWFRLIVAGTFSACLFMYFNFYSPSSTKNSQDKLKKEAARRSSSHHVKSLSSKVSSAIDLLIPGKGQGLPSPQCIHVKAPQTDIYTTEQYQQFDFQVTLALPLQADNFFNNNSIYFHLT